MPPFPGQKLGPYEIILSLGAGGMGEVWKARDTRLERAVAIKSMPADKLSDPDRCRRFLQEARAASALHHPNIVTIYDLLDEGGVNYIVMEYVAGQTLGDLIPNGGMRPPQALRIARQTADALACAHAAGIVHRDLKPSNVMVCEEGQVKVLDFGLAKVLHQDSELTATVTGLAGHTMAGTIVGTASYMSPEQVEGRPVDARSDIFSFGALLYEMLTGRKPFRGDSRISTMAAVLHVDPDALPPGIPADLEHVITRCLRKEPHRRYQQTIELKLALEEAAEPGKSSSSSMAAKAPLSLIVLPFTNLSADKENDYFADGLTEEILSALSAVSGLRIIARTSTFAARERELSLAQITEQMKVTHALEGSVRRSGSRIRVTAKLFTTGDQTQLWSERFDREMSDIFEVQDEIARAVVSALKGRFFADPGEKMVEKPTSNIEAYSLLLRARHDMFKLDAAHVAKAEEHLRQVIALDPNCAFAHAMIAWRLWTSIILGTREPRPAIAEAAAAARKALDIDHRQPLALVCAALVSAVLDWNWREFERLMQQAYALAPDDPDVAHGYAFWYLRFKGRYSEAIGIYDLIAMRDPLSGNWPAFQASLAYSVRDYEKAKSLIKTALDIDGTQLLAHWLTCRIAPRTGDIERGLASGAEAVRLNGGSDWVRGAYAITLADAGRHDEALAIRDRLREESKRRYVPPLAMINASIACKDDEGALAAVEQVADDRSPNIFWLVDDPALDPLRRYPRYSAVLARIGLPERY